MEGTMVRNSRLKQNKCSVIKQPTNYKLKYLWSTSSIIETTSYLIFIFWLPIQFEFLRKYLDFG